MTKIDIAAYLGIDVQTMRNWQKTRPNLYRVIMQGLAIDEVKDILKESQEKLEHLGNSQKSK